MTAPAAAHPKRESAAWTGLVLAVLLPLAVVALLRLAPKVDERWENSPAHFWLVLTTAAVATALAAAISENGRRRRDARLLLIGLAFVVSAAFLGLHSLATPGVILSGKKAASRSPRRSGSSSPASSRPHRRRSSAPTPRC